MIKKLIILCSLLALAACSSGAPPKPGMKLGKPYMQNGKVYFPENDTDYDEEGLGSWYGPGFHGKRTASGERFNENDITAAHPTLPMPTLVRITNMTNGKTVIARINDRGPFHSKRIIDLSKRTAQIIDLHSTMQVRVQYLKEETETYLEAVKNNDTEKMDMLYYNKGAEDVSGWNYQKNKKRNDEAEIVESTVVTKQLDNTVEDVAPVMSVESSDLSSPTSKKSTKTSETASNMTFDPPITEEKTLPAPAKRVNKWADDNVTLPEPPADDSDAPQAFNPPKNKGVTVESLAAKATKQQPAAAAPEPKGSYVIFAGSYASEANARGLAKKLSKATVDKVTANGKTLWRVHAGPFSKKADAEKALTIVHTSGAPDALIKNK